MSVGIFLMPPYTHKHTLNLDYHYVYVMHMYPFISALICLRIYPCTYPWYISSLLPRIPNPSICLPCAPRPGSILIPILRMRNKRGPTSLQRKARTPDDLSPLHYYSNKWQSHPWHSSRRILLLDPLREQTGPSTMQRRNHPTGKP